MPEGLAVLGRHSRHRRGPVVRPGGPGGVGAAEEARWHARGPGGIGEAACPEGLVALEGIAGIAGGGPGGMPEGPAAPGRGGGPGRRPEGLAALEPQEEGPVACPRASAASEAACPEGLGVGGGHSRHRRRARWHARAWRHGGGMPGGPGGLEADGRQPAGGAAGAGGAGGWAGRAERAGQGSGQVGRAHQR